MEKTDLAYIAGIFDGEGTIRINKGRMGRKEGYLYSMSISLGLTNDFIPMWLQLCFGGRVSLKFDPDPKHKNCYIWRICAQRAVNFLEAILPYLKLKAPHAKIAIEFQANQKGQGKHIRLSDEELAIREAEFLLMKSLNKKGK